MEKWKYGKFFFKLYKNVYVFSNDMENEKENYFFLISKQNLNIKIMHDQQLFR